MEKISLTWMKNQAKKLKRASDKTHMQCLDIVAKEYGFENYSEAYRKRYRQIMYESFTYIPRITGK